MKPKLVVVEKKDGKFGVVRVKPAPQKVDPEIYGSFDSYEQAEQEIRDANKADYLAFSDKNQY